jgi:hypothetical protein
MDHVHLFVNGVHKAGQPMLKSCATGDADEALYFLQDSIIQDNWRQKNANTDPEAAAQKPEPFPPDLRKYLNSLAPAGTELRTLDFRDNGVGGPVDQLYPIIDLGGLVVDCEMVDLGIVAEDECFAVKNVGIPDFEVNLPVNGVHVPAARLAVLRYRFPRIPVSLSFQTNSNCLFFQSLRDSGVKDLVETFPSYFHPEIGDMYAYRKAYRMDRRLGELLKLRNTGARDEMWTERIEDFDTFFGAEAESWKSEETKITDRLKKIQALPFPPSARLTPVNVPYMVPLGSKAGARLRFNPSFTKVEYGEIPGRLYGQCISPVPLADDGEGFVRFFIRIDEIRHAPPGMPGSYNTGDEGPGFGFVVVKAPGGNGGVG